MQEWTAADPSRTIRRFSSFQEQEDETIRYWNSRSMAEKLRLTAEITTFFYRQKGIDVDAHGSTRSLVRVQRSWS